MSEDSVESIAEKYRAVERDYEDLCREVEFSLDRKLRDSGIKVHAIASRVKDADSFLEKIDRKDYSNPFEQVEDIAGIRVVCLFMLDLDRTGGVIESIFEVLEKEDKINEGEVSAFGYMSHHYICRLSDRYSGERYDRIKNLKFEIQVRTILMDAWANMSHYLSYKSPESIPQELAKDFHALSALLFVGDRQFEALYKSSSRSAASAEAEVLRSSQVSELEINADTVGALLGRVFPDRDRPSAAAVSAFTSELHEFGFRNIAEVGKILEGDKSAALSAERLHPPHGAKGQKFNQVGIARQVIDAHDGEYARFRKEKAKRAREERDRESR